MHLPLVSTLGLTLILSLALPASAAVSIDWVTIGNPGNATDPLTGNGSVSDTYNIGKYEVTNAQYVEFLNSKAASDPYGLWNSTMSDYWGGITRNGTSGSYNYSLTTGSDNRPLVGVTWFSAARFCNWLENGQGNGDTESGAYLLNGAIGGNGNIPRSIGATIYLPTEDEWYKAAYFNPQTGLYSTYANGLNTISTSEANYNWSVGNPTDSGAYGTLNPYGTYDQNGNVAEWTETPVSTWAHEWRGGSLGHDSSMLAATSSPHEVSTASNYWLGFRVASVPEPSALILTALFGAAVFSRRKR